MYRVRHSLTIKCFYTSVLSQSSCLQDIKLLRKAKRLSNVVKTLKVIKSHQGKIDVEYAHSTPCVALISLQITIKLFIKENDNFEGVHCHELEFMQTTAPWVLFYRSNYPNTHGHWAV